MKGIIHVTGEHDTGKTTFALECGVPASRIAFFDDDVKGSATVDEIGREKFGRYVNLVSLGTAQDELAFFEAVKAELDTIKEGNFDCIIFDTWSRIAQSMHAYVLKYPKEFRGSYAPMGRIKGAQQWQDTRRLERELLNKLRTLCPTVILVTHLKSQYINDVNTGQMQPDSSKTLDQVCRLRLWLRHNPSGSPVPTALVLKRVDQKILDDDGHIRTVSVLPRKLVPADGERNLWDTIKRYQKMPVDNRPLLPEELPDEYEAAILGGTLTEDQKHVLNEVLRLGLVNREDIEEKPDINFLIADDTLSPAEVVQKAADLDVKITPAEVIKWRNQ